MTSLKFDSCLRPPTHPSLPAFAVFALTLVSSVSTAAPASAVLAPKAWIAPIEVDSAPGSQLISTKFEDAARLELRKLKTLQMVGPAEKRLKVVVGQHDPRLDEAENLRTSGQARFQSGDVDGAKADLEAALKLYELALPSVHQLDVIARTLAHLGAIASTKGDTRRQKRLFRRAALIASGEETFDGLSKRQRSTLLALRKRLQRGKRRIVVVTNPPGATIRVNGIEHGTSPVTVKGLASGRHYVQAHHEKAGAAAKLVRLRRKRARATLKLTTDIGAPPASEVPANTISSLRLAIDKKKTRKRSFRKLVKNVVGHSHADYLVVTRLGANKLGFLISGHVYGVRQKRLKALEPIQLGRNLSGVFIQGIAFAKAVDTAVSHLQSSAPAKKKASRRKRR